MDSRNNLQNSFTRPLSQPHARDPRQAPIPPPPYTLQTPTHRLQPSLNNDPFLPRRNDRDESRREPPMPSSQGPYSLGSYPANLPRDGLRTPMEIRDRPQENSHAASWMPRLADGRTDRYRHHATEGKIVSCKVDVFFSSHHCLLPTRKSTSMFPSFPSLGIALRLTREWARCCFAVCGHDVCLRSSF